MINRDFGKNLYFFRLQTIDPKTGKPITQQKLGELVGHELGRSAYTGAAISDWERGKSRISADDRLLLISLVKILNRYGGIRFSDDANLLFESGNFRALNAEERERIFPGFRAENESPILLSQNISNLQFLLDGLKFIPFADYQVMLEKAKQGPPPYWPRAAVFVIRRLADSFTAVDVLTGIIWIWIIWLAHKFFIAPSLAWNFSSRENTLQIMTLYAAGSLIIPALIGGLTNTKDNPYWAAQNMRRSVMLRLYVHQGAYVGYHSGYFITLLTMFVQIMLGLRLPEWLGVIHVIFPLVVSYAGARLIPYNLWLAYSRLDLKDGGVFFIFAVLGPLWALFLLEFYDLLSYPIIGAVLVLSALALLALRGMMKRRSHKTPVE